MTFTINEGKELRKIVRQKKRVFALGSQQRSDSNFQHALSCSNGALEE